MPPRLLLALVPAAAMLVLAGFDIRYETENPGWGEIAVELGEKVLMVGAMVAVAFTVLRVDRVSARAEAMRDRLDRAMSQGAEWRAQRAGEIAALSEAIAAEFRAWGLSPAEADVAGLLLKGASMKDVAAARDTSEATIRQQAQSIYRKSGLGGRAELQAYFLDGLFGDTEERRLRVVS